MSICYYLINMLRDTKAKTTDFWCHW